MRSMAGEALAGGSRFMLQFFLKWAAVMTGEAIHLGVRRILFMAGGAVIFYRRMDPFHFFEFLMALGGQTVCVLRC